MKRALFMLVICSSAALWAQQAAPSSKAGQPPAKHVAQAKTDQEFKDYTAAYAVAGGTALEKAADEFAAKYPASELKIFVYEKAMHEYQAENNEPKTLATAEKVLQLDPDNAIALVLTANVLSDLLSENDSDRDKKIAEIRKNGSHALQLMDANFSPVANATPEQVAAYKKTLQALAHLALGITALKVGDDAGAENELKAAAEVNPSQPDPYIWYHLALAQDHQKKYDEALVSVKQALHDAASNPEIGELAKGEQSRLLTLTGGSTPSPEKLSTPAPK
jgi:tetratricopeptide (TPR) repeat protein